MSENPKLVFNIEAASASMVRAMDVHERLRAPDGTSAIDPLRRHLNEVMVGLMEGPARSLDAFYRSGVQKPTAQAEAPYARIVISASPQYFRPGDPKAAGTWDEARMTAWRDKTLAWLKAQFGDDLVYASLHLDEDTPHVHALVAPTYTRKPRVPGRQKRHETAEEFAARKAEAQAAEGVRTVGRASHELLKKRDSFMLLRKSLALAVADLGIEYGEDRTPEAPASMSTREWVRQETVRLRRERAQADQEAAARKADLDRAQAEFGQEKAEAREALNRDRARLDQDRAELDQERAEMVEERAQLDGEWYRLGEDQAALAEERRDLRRQRKAVDALLDRLRDLVGRVTVYLRRPDLPKEARRDGRELVQELEELERPGL